MNKNRECVLGCLTVLFLMIDDETLYSSAVCHTSLSKLVSQTSIHL